LNDYVVSPNIVNQFIFAANWYTAYFGPANANATLAAFPTYLSSMLDGGSNGSAAPSSFNGVEAGPVNWSWLRS
jgi:hypothetical protein